MAEERRESNTEEKPKELPEARAKKVSRIVGQKFVTFELPVGSGSAELLIDLQLRIVKSFVEACNEKLGGSLPKKKYTLQYSLLELKG